MGGAAGADLGGQGAHPLPQKRKEQKEREREKNKERVGKCKVWTSQAHNTLGVTLTPVFLQCRSAPGVRNPRKCTFWTKPPHKTPLLAYFVTKSGPFGPNPPHKTHFLAYFGTKSGPFGPNPPHKPQFLAHFVAQSGPFGIFFGGGGASYTPHPPGYRPAPNISGKIPVGKHHPQLKDFQCELHIVDFQSICSLLLCHNNQISWSFVNKESKSKESDSKCLINFNKT